MKKTLRYLFCFLPFVGFSQQLPNFPEHTLGLIPNCLGSTNFYDTDADGLIDTCIQTGFINLVFPAFQNSTSMTRISYYNESTNSFVYETNGTMMNASQSVAIASELDDQPGLDIYVSGSTSLVGAGLAESKLYMNYGRSNATVINLTHVLDHVSAEFADLDNDGDQDLVTSGIDNNGNTRFVIYRNDDGLLTEVVHYVNNNSIWKGSLVVSDFDNDNDIDIGLIGRESSSVIIGVTFINNGNYNFTINNTLTPSDLSSLVSADLNGDGILDMGIFGKTGSGGAEFVNEIALGDGMGNFTPTIQTNLDEYWHTTALFHDFSGDNVPDLFLAGSAPASGLGFSGVYVNDGNGIFAQKDSNFTIPGIVYGDANIINLKINGIAKKLFHINGAVRSYGFGPNTMIAKTYILGNAPLSTNEFNDMSKNILLYPNPARDIINLELTSDDNLKSLTIFDIQGRNVYQESNTNSSTNMKQINVSELAAGMYTVQIVTDNGNMGTKKLLIE